MNKLQKLCNDFYNSLVEYERMCVLDSGKIRYRNEVTKPVAVLMLKIHKISDSFESQ